MDYKLYYWEAPFRGNFLRILLEEAGVDYKEEDPTDIYPEKRLEIDFPGMAPPYLYDCSKEKYLCQMPAALMYLAHKENLLPKDLLERSLTNKLILDCNDVLIEITNYNGSKMWNRKEWKEFRSERLAMWMKIFEATGERHDLKQDAGFILGKNLGAADIAVTALFGTMIHCLPPLKDDLCRHAPKIANLLERMEERPDIAKFLRKQRKDYGTIYCGGEIEKSIREMLEKDG